MRRQLFLNAGHHHARRPRCRQRIVGAGLNGAQHSAAAEQTRQGGAGRAPPALEQFSTSSRAALLKTEASNFARKATRPGAAEPG